MWGVCKLGSGVNVGNVNLGQHHVILLPPQDKLILLPPQACLPLLSAQDVLDGVGGEPGREKGHHQNSDVKLSTSARRNCCPSKEEPVRLPSSKVLLFTSFHFSPLNLFIARPPSNNVLRILSFDQLFSKSPLKLRVSIPFDHSSSPPPVACSFIQREHQLPPSTFATL